MDVEPLVGTSTRGTFNVALAGRRERAVGFVYFNEAPFSVVSRATVNLEAGAHKDTDRGSTTVKDALLPTRSLSSFSSHILSSIICSFCCWRVSCICCRSRCHRRWASSRLFASTRTNSPSWNEASATQSLIGQCHRQPLGFLCIDFKETAETFLHPRFSAAGT